MMHEGGLILRHDRAGVPGLSERRLGPRHGIVKRGRAMRVPGVIVDIQHSGFAHAFHQL